MILGGMLPRFSSHWGHENLGCGPKIGRQTFIGNKSFPTGPFGSMIGGLQTSREHIMQLAPARNPPDKLSSSLIKLKSNIAGWELREAAKALGRLHKGGFNPDQPRDDRGRWGTGNSSTADSYSPSRPGWHDYVAGPHVVCAAELRCTREEVLDQFHRFAVPGQDPTRPVQNRGIYKVYDPITGFYAGKVDTTISDDGATVKNETKHNHILRDGQIIRHIEQTQSGDWQVTTHGIGNNVFLGMNYANQYGGPVIFEVLDNQMRNNIRRHHGASKAWILDRLQLGDAGDAGHVDNASSALLIAGGQNAF